MLTLTFFIVVFDKKKVLRPNMLFMRWGMAMVKELKTLTSSYKLRRYQLKNAPFFFLHENSKGMKDNERKLLDRQVLGVIQLKLSKNVDHNMATEKSTTNLMKVLSNMYEKPFACNKLHLMQNHLIYRWLKVLQQ